MNEKNSHKEILIIKAKEDLETAQKLIELGDYSEEIVLFHCQQAIEKALKAFLDSKGIIYPKTHDLETLLSMCIEKEKSFNEIDFVTSLTPYAVDIRYDEFTPQSRKDVDEIVSKVEKSLNFIIKKV